ncbi:regulator of protease activity HflC (stomatin/prohibitin superfamily) [Pseudomonas nitritireducens]|uniref:Regulator of protease activity HflC (Stomatin/prohibitin superfamily) n=1 Tax=Pseudomonas nitroreducens TaxID=46680 RepID=A0A7W7KQQ4_PSENT|nr:prohibitin family protein [Pseudomonas nitritireducens]MBB4866805.1 regulator of protease activity HflC (stomatin/prohibitin superfamily) [Pseudomonas nitritireducens]
MSSEIPVGKICGGLLAFVVACALIGSAYTIDEKERGVVLTNGKYDTIAEPGLHLKWPFFQSVVEISTQRNTTRYEGLQAYSKDQQTAGLVVSVSWHVEPGMVAEVYRNYGNVDSLVARLLSRQVPTQVEAVFGRYTAIQAVQNRGQLTVDVGAAIKEATIGPIVIDSVQVEGLDFSDVYEKSVENRMLAEVAIQTRQQNLATEQVQAQIKVTQAQADADAKVAQAKADAEATRLRGQADADAIRAKAEALASNQNLIELTKAERWNGELPKQMVPGSSVPFLNVNK